MSISKRILLVPLALAEAIHIFSKPCHSKIMIFHAKIGILGKYLFVSRTLSILYLEGNHSFLFGEKLYFIWKFSICNTETTCCIYLSMIFLYCYIFTHKNLSIKKILYEIMIEATFIVRLFLKQSTY